MEPILYSSAIKHDSDEKKLLNVGSFANLDRSGLALESRERNLLMKTFDTGEKVYLHYPGKEVVQRGSRSARPWDFRPKIQLADGTWLPDLSFKDIWDDLYAFKDLHLDMATIATIFFRIAYMLDTKLVTRQLVYEDYDGEGNPVDSGVETVTWYEYEPPADLLDGLNVPPEALRGCSLPAYLCMNDYLAQNEDCKYFYRAKYEKGESWKTDTGRRNTLLTHMSVIGFIEGHLTFTEIMDMFQRGLGVAALPAKYWSTVTHDHVIK